MSTFKTATHWELYLEAACLALEASPRSHICWSVGLWLFYTSLFLIFAKESQRGDSKEETWGEMKKEKHTGRITSRKVTFQSSLSPLGFGMENRAVQDCVHMFPRWIDSLFSQKFPSFCLSEHLLSSQKFHLHLSLMNSSDKLLKILANEPGSHVKWEPERHRQDCSFLQERSCWLILLFNCGMNREIHTVILI